MNQDDWMANWMRKGQKEGRKKKIAGKKTIKKYLNNKMMNTLISTHKQITQFFSIWINYKHEIVCNYRICLLFHFFSPFPHEPKKLEMSAHSQKYKNR